MEKEFSSKKIKKSTVYTGIASLIVVGVIFLIVGLSLFISAQISKNNYKQTTAVISEIREEMEWDEEDNEYELNHYVFVDYEVDGVKYTKRKYNQYKISMKEGDEIKIYYNIKKPYLITSNPSSSKVVWIVFIGISLVPLFLGVRSLIKELKKEF